MEVFSGILFVDYKASPGSHNISVLVNIYAGASVNADSCLKSFSLLIVSLRKVG